MDRYVHRPASERFVSGVWLLVATIALTAAVMAGVILTGSGTLA